MKKLFSMLAVFALVVVSAFTFSACGKKAETLTNEDVVGVWYSTQVVVAGRANASENGTYTYEKYLELKAKEDSSTPWGAGEETLYYALKNVLQNYKLEEGVGDEKGKVYCKGIAQADLAYSVEATWEIVDNQVKLYTDDEDVSSITWTKDGDSVTVTVSFANNSSCTYTLAKVAA